MARRHATARSGSGVGLLGIWLGILLACGEARSQSPLDLPAGVELSGVYTVDALSNVDGGRREGTAYLGDLSVMLTLRSASLLGWRGATLHVYGLVNHGRSASARVGDLQGVSSIEARDDAQIYEAWIQQNLVGDRLSLLVGFYDLNSEFDVIRTAGVFLNGSFGIGAEYGLSGRNGPSIFPATSLAARLAFQPGEGTTLRVAGFDGVPGDPGAPRGGGDLPERDDGLLVAWEVAHVGGGRFEEARERGRIGRARSRPPYRGKVALGGWLYTDGDARPSWASGTVGSGLTSRSGVYALAEYLVLPKASDSSDGLRVFARAGLADPRSSPVRAYTGAGLVYRGLGAGRPDDQVGLGVAAAHLSPDYRAAVSGPEGTPPPSEVAVELTYHMNLGAGIGLQPDLQYVLRPAGGVGMEDAWVAGIRLQISR